MFLWMSSLLLILPQLIAAQPPPSRIFVSAPNIIRVGNTETVLINVFDSGEVTVSVTLQNSDGSNICPPVLVNVDTTRPAIVPLFVDPATVSEVEPSDDIKTYAKIVIECEAFNFHQEKDILVGYEQGFVFLQTDKPIYTPDQRVNIRLMILDQYLRPSNEPVQLDVLSPQDVIVHRTREVRAHNGFKNKVFTFPHEPLFGNWSVVAHYGKDLKSNRSIQFEVKEYVLPTFSVKLSTSPEFVLPGQEAIDVTISARYVYDKPVLGLFYAKVGILGIDGEIEIKHRASGSMLGNGVGFFRVNTVELGENWFEEYEGTRLYLEVSVLETASGRRENVSDSSVKFVRSPYKFSWERTVLNFKKGLPYEVKVDLKHPNDRPADRVPVEVSAKGIQSDGQEVALFGGHDENRQSQRTLSHTNNRGQVDFRLYIPEDCDSIQIRLETKDERWENHDGTNNNADIEFQLQPYNSPTSNDFLVIRAPGRSDIVNINSELEIEALVRTQDVIPRMAYYVLTKGRIVYAGVLNRPLQNLQGFRVPVTHEMAPSARIVAYYVNQAGHVVADSLRIDVQRVCENQVIVSVHERRSTTVYKPDETIDLMVDALPHTTVGLLAVDKAVYLLRDYHRLTEDKMYKVMDSYDSGCGPGGGRDSADIFEQAGIIVLSNTLLDVERREVYGCLPLNSRQRRSQQARFENVEDFACHRGEATSRQSCHQRKERFLSFMRNLPDDHRFKTNDTERIGRIFMECCLGSSSRGRSGANHFDNPDLIMDRPEDVAVRSDFRETWIFDVVEIGESGFFRQQYTTPSSITEWTVTAVGLSNNYAMCVARPLDILVRKDLFIQLDMPYSVIRREQIEIVATIFNYGTTAYAGTVFLHTTEKVCSEGDSNNFSAMKTVRIPPNEAVTVPYAIIALEVGEHPITVSVVTTGPNDAVEKILRVLPEGIERTFFSTTTLDPTGRLRQQIGQQPQARARQVADIVHNEVIQPGEKRQHNFFDIRLPDSAVKDSEKCEVSIIGNVLGPVITSVIEGLDSLLKLPRGCGEQTMIYLAPNVYVLRYLSRNDQVPPELEAKATHNIEEGIMREMTHRRADGSFSVWGTNVNYPSSTWLTAFVNKVFCHAQEFAFVDNKVTCQAMEWLIDTAQRNDGAFVETYRVHHREMTGGVQGDATLTAFVLISLLECQCVTLSAEVQQSADRAVQFLESQLDFLQRPYAVAIVAYALVLADSNQKDYANTRLKSMDRYDPEEGLRYWSADASSLSDSAKPYWYRVRPSAISVETTGYALLAQLAHEDATYSKPIVKWLSKQQNYGGGFASTQDTTIALQALSEYASNNDGGEVNMTCVIEQGTVYREQFNLTKENALVQRHATPPVNGSLTVRTEGTGTGKLNVKVTYNTISEDINERPCPFTIEINAREARHADEEDENERRNKGRGDRVDQGRSRVGRQAVRQEDRGALILNVRVRVAYNKNEPTNMAIIDVGLYSGFVPIKEDLDQIVADNDYISRYEITQRSVTLYADLIPPLNHDPSLTFEFKVKREHTVGNIKPVALKVYDYYNPTEECVKFYHPSSADAGDALLDTVCDNDRCICAEGSCASDGPHTKEQLVALSCANANTYAYQILVTDSTLEPNGFRIFTAQIKKVLKRANDWVFVEEFRQFWLSSSCASIRLQNNKRYLMIGETHLPSVDRDGNESVNYIIDGASTIELWPTNNKRRLQAQKQKMEEFERDMNDESANNCQ